MTIHMCAVTSEACFTPCGSKIKAIQQIVWDLPVEKRPTLYIKQRKPSLNILK